MLLAWQGKAGRKILGKWPSVLTLVLWAIWKMILLGAAKHVLICNLQISFTYVVLFNPDTRQGGLGFSNFCFYRNHLGVSLKCRFQDFLAHGDSNVISQEGAIDIWIFTSVDFESHDAYPYFVKLELIKEELLVPIYISENDSSSR